MSETYPFTLPVTSKNV